MSRDSSDPDLTSEYEEFEKNEDELYEEGYSGDKSEVSPKSQFIRDVLENKSSSHSLYPSRLSRSTIANFRSLRNKYFVNVTMGWGQQAVVPGKRVYNNENADNSIPVEASSKEKTEEEEDDMRAQYTKRSRDTSPQRKPLGSMDIISCKKGDTCEDYIKKHDTLYPSVSSPNAIGDSFNLQDIPFDTSACYEEKSKLTQNGTTDMEFQSRSANGKGDEFGFAIPSILPSQNRPRTAYGSNAPKLGLPVGLKKCHIDKNAISARKIYNLKNRSSCAVTAEETTSEEDSSSEYSNTFDDVTDDEECGEIETDITPPTATSSSDVDSSGETDISETCSVDVVPTPALPLKTVKAVRPSLFPYVPPYVNFCQHDEECESLPAEVRQLMKWRLSTITPIVVRKTVLNSGFRAMKKTVEWTGHWGKHMKPGMFRLALKDYQKLNHMPGTFNLGRKDKLWTNYQKLSFKFGKEHFGFLPRTYLLPSELKQFKCAWDANRGRPWIVKPPACARGTGISVVNKWGQIPKKRSTIVQKYISKPFLINARKFDIRIYVLVTSFHPLKIYLYREGLVRFAPVKYSEDSKRVSDRFMHLTNYSINKHCDLYTQNSNAEALEGHKWTLKSLWRYLRDLGHDTDKIWSSLEDIAIKTIICCETPITALAYNLPSRYNGYELFGFDIIFDENLKPWLLEVNISPSLHSSSPLDLAVKGPLVKECFNIACYHFPTTMSNSVKKKLQNFIKPPLKLETPVMDKRLFSSVLSPDEKLKHATIKKHYSLRKKYLPKILENLTPDDIRHLIHAEDELSQCDGFKRIFPSDVSHEYLQFLEGPRYYNQLLDAWEFKYGNDRKNGIKMLQSLCNNKLHLSCVQTSSSKDTILDKNDVRLEFANKPLTNQNSEEDLTNGNGSTTSLEDESTSSPVSHKLN